MFSRCTIVVLLGWLIAVTPVGAQDGRAASGENQPGSKKAADAESDRSTIYRLGLYRDIEEQVEEMTESVGLDAAQQTDVKAALETFDAERKKIHEEFTSQSPDEQDKIRGIREARVKALQENDQEALKAIEADMQAMRDARLERFGKGRELLTAAEAKLHQAITATLRADQKAKFEQYWESQSVENFRRQGPTRNPRALKTFVQRLDDYSANQREQVEALFQAYQAERRNLKPEDARSREWIKRTEKLYDDVYALLTPEQKKEVDTKLKGTTIQGRLEGARPGPKAPGKPAHPADRE